MIMILFITVGSIIGGGTAFAGRLRRPGHWSTDVLIGAACALAGGMAFRILGAARVENVPTFGLGASAFYSLVAAVVVASLALAVRELLLPHRFGGRFALRRILPGLRAGAFVQANVHRLRAEAAHVMARERRP